MLPAGDTFLFFGADEVFGLWTPAPSAEPARTGALGIVATEAEGATGVADAVPTPGLSSAVQTAAPGLRADAFAMVWNVPVIAGSGGDAPAPDATPAETLTLPGLGPIGAVAAMGAASFHAGAFTGHGKTVVVIDTGWSPWYDQSNTIFSYDFSGRNDADASLNTLNSHGSWVAQTVLGVAAEADIIHLKVFTDWGSGNTADVEEALRWCVANVDRYDIVAVNLSLGYGNAVAPTWTGLSDEFAALDALGVFNIVAAGNSGGTYKKGVNVIAADPNAIAVSATGANDRFTSWTQKHAALTDIAALGAGIEVETVNGFTGYVSGTSFAAPYIAGIAARLQEATEAVFGVGARLDQTEFLDILRASGDRVRGAPGSWKGAVVADADAAVDWFLDNAAAYADAVWV
jgi:hypothetical protein